MHHLSKEGKIFQDPVTKEKYLVFEWFEHSPGIIRAVRKEKIQDQPVLKVYCPICQQGFHTKIGYNLHFVNKKDGTVDCPEVPDQ